MNIKVNAFTVAQKLYYTVQKAFKTTIEYNVGKKGISQGGS